MKNIYKPNPINTEDVILSEDLLALTEKIAANVHDVWAEGRIAEGWKYGPVKNPEKKETPQLVAYEDLPESEKEYDRNTALSTLKLIVKMGYRIGEDSSEEAKEAPAQLQATEVSVDLKDWARPYPTGAILYDENHSVIGSDYCESVEDFEDFLDINHSKISENAELSFVVSGEDIINDNLISLASDMKEAWDSMMEVPEESTPKYKFGKDIFSGDMILRYGEYIHDGIAIDAWDEEGPFADVSEFVPEVPVADDEIILNHDVLFDRDFVDGLISYLADSTRDVSFGPFNTRTIVLKLKENWKELCVPMG